MLGSTYVLDCSGTREEDEPKADLSVRDAGPETGSGATIASHENDLSGNLTIRPNWLLPAH
jgi:hypothetical protein